MISMLKDKSKLAYCMFLIFAAAFVFIVSKGLATPQPGDENVYYYMGKLVSEGKAPYRDFFFAHPPLHVYLIALVYRLSGFNIFLLKLIPLISILTSAFFIFKMVKEKFGNAEALTASLLFLSSYSIMFNSVFSFGIEVATMLLAIGVYFLWAKNKYFIAGIFFGLAGITRLLSLVPILVMLAVVLFSSKKIFLKLSYGFFIVFLLVNGIFALLFADNYLFPVYQFHLLKSFGSGENIREYTDIIKLNWLLFSSFLLFVFLKEKKQISMLAVASVTYLIFLAMLNKIFGFYFIIAFPFLAIIGGYSIVNLYKKINLSKKWKYAIPIILLVIFAWDLAANVLFLEKIGFKGFERGKDLASFVNSVSDENTLLFGDDSVVPLLALLTNKKIAFDFADTNNEVFITGVRDLNKALSDLRGRDVLFIIRSKQGISYFNDVKAFLNKNCDFLGQFHDKIEGDYLVYRCS